MLLHFWKPVLMGALLALAAFLLSQRVRELRGLSALAQYNSDHATTGKTDAPPQ